MTTGSSPVPGALARLFDRRPMDAVEWGLDRIEALLAALDNPHRAFETIHIAGTNGKGSTATFAASVLAAHGHRVGLYTSPHLDDLRERFVVGGVPVEDTILERVATEMLALPEAEPATYFEVATAVAFAAFREAGVDWAVVETGLGGRLDATNVIEPRVAVVTTIGIDHADVLGDTPEAIAAEKGGIFKRGVPAVLGNVSDRAREVLEEAARRVAAPVATLGDEGSILDVTTRLEGTQFRYSSRRWPDGLELKTGLVGRHQAENASLAILALESAGLRLGRGRTRRAIAGAVIPGRFEIRKIGRETWVLDIAHNREGLEAVMGTLEEVNAPRPRVSVVGILSDKPWAGMLEMLRLDMQAIILTQAGSAPKDRCWNLPEVSGATDAGATALRVEPDLGRALEMAAQEGAGGTILVTGSMYTVSAARRELTGT
ncbi:MAG: folylpolyglutamate synthase/dihydrofolate synthase family protein [Gemmatimonadota bacterium]